MKAFTLIMVTLMCASVFAEEAAPVVTKCYSCNSNEDPSCADVYTPKESHLADCTNGETNCRKIVQEVEGVTSYVRQCAKELKSPDFEGCYKTAGKANQNVCTCKAVDGKACNSASIAQSSFGALVLSVMVAKLFF